MIILLTSLDSKSLNMTFIFEVACENDKECINGYYCHIPESKTAGFCHKGTIITF